LGPGIFADIAVVSVGGGDSPDEIEEAILDASPDRVHATFASGRPVYRSGQPT
jgi:hypothetical protein